MQIQVKNASIYSKRAVYKPVENRWIGRESIEWFVSSCRIPGSSEAVLTQSCNKV